MRVYGLLRVLRDKCPSDPAPALEAAIAVRDVMVMMAASTCPSCEHALQDIAVPSEEQQLSMSEFRSQILMAQSSVSRVARCISNYDKEICHIYRVPLFPHEVDDIFATYSDCATQDTAKRGRKPPRKRAPKNCGCVLDDQSEPNFHVFNEAQPLAITEPFRVSTDWDQVRYESAGFSSGLSHLVHIRWPFWSLN